MALRTSQPVLVCEGHGGQSIMKRAVELQKDPESNQGTQYDCNAEGKPRTSKIKSWGHIQLEGV